MNGIKEDKAECMGLILQRLDGKLLLKWYPKGFGNEEGWRDIEEISLWDITDVVYEGGLEFRLNKNQVVALSPEIGSGEWRLVFKINCKILKEIFS